MENVGDAVQESTHLRTLTIIDDSDGRAPYGLPSFFMGLAQNRSIEQLTFHRFNHCYLNIFTTLAPFFENNTNLRCIEITSSTNIAAKLSFLTSALGKTKYLMRLDLANNGIGDQETAELVKAMAGVPALQSIVELCLGGNNIKKMGCKSLADWLKGGAKIERLNLQENELNDECIKILTKGLVASNFIKDVNLGSQAKVTSTGWQSFFQAVLADPNCTLKSIGLGGNNLGDAGVIALGNALIVNNRVKFVNVRASETTITPNGWRGFTKCLTAPGSALEELDFSGCYINDEGAVVIATALAGNASVTKLSMTHNQSISSAGWMECFRLWTGRTTPLVSLDLSYNSIDDAGAAMLTNILGKMSTLSSLDLSGNRSMSSTGWCAFADLLKPNADCKLKELTVLDLRGARYDDDVVVCYFNALVGNTSLEKMFFWGQVLLKESGFFAMFDALHDKRSIVGTYNSNHTLKKIVCGAVARREELGIALALNCKSNKSEVARKKILLHHLMDVEDAVDVFGSMGARILPTALSWVGRDRKEYSMMFHVLKKTAARLLDSSSEPHAA